MQRFNGKMRGRTRPPGARAVPRPAFLPGQHVPLPPELPPPMAFYAPLAKKVAWWCKLVDADGQETVDARIEARLRAPGLKIAQKTYLRALAVATGGKEIETLVDDFVTRHQDVAVTSLDAMVQAIRAVHTLAKEGAPLDGIKAAALDVLAAFVLD